jgi:hypothetical protein
MAQYMIAPATAAMALSTIPEDPYCTPSSNLTEGQVKGKQGLDVLTRTVALLATLCGPTSHDPDVWDRDREDDRYGE